MAVVFISPKQRQKVFLMGIIAAFALFLGAIALIVFFSQPKQSQARLVFNKPKVSLDFKILESDQFKNLDAYAQMDTQYTYRATMVTGKGVEGLISAFSVEDARKLLESLNLSVVDIQEVKNGRDNPFTPYSQAAPAAATNKTVTPAKGTTTKK
jgi:predicted tellurium resistance membrane protein TerC